MCRRAQFKASLSYITVKAILGYMRACPKNPQSINQEAAFQSHVFYESSTHLRVLGFTVLWYTRSNVPGSFRLQEEFPVLIYVFMPLLL